MGGFLELTDDGRIQRLLKRAVHKAIDKVDLTETSAVMLESMTKTTVTKAAGRHHKPPDYPDSAGKHAGIYC